MRSPVRVLIVDDSALMRRRLGTLVESASGFEVAGFAATGIECLEQIAALRPEVVTLDVEMPGLDGLGTLQRIMQECPTPVLMVSSLTESGAQTTIDALALGAVDYLAKPAIMPSTSQSPFAAELIAKLAVVSRARLLRTPRRVATIPPSGAVPRRAILAERRSSLHTPLVVIGTSTGGPQALDVVFEHLLPVPSVSFIIVQHMPPIFTRSLAARLSRHSALPVEEAAEGDVLNDQRALIAPGGMHLTIGTDGRAHLDQTAAIHGVRPALDRTLASIAGVWRGPVLAVIMTGMGVDGTDGARALRAHGSEIYAQDENTCVVYGMPRSIVDAGLASAILPLDRIGEAVMHWARGAAPRFAHLA